MRPRQLDNHPLEAPRILIVEKDPRVGMLLRAELVRLKYSVVLTPSRFFAVRCLSLRQFDLLVLAIDSGEARHHGLLQYLQRSESRMPILVLVTTVEQVGAVVAMLPYCADFIQKPFSMSDIERRIRSLLVPDPAADRRLAVYRDLEIDRVARIARRDGQPMTMNDRQFDVLAFLTARAGTIVSRDDLTRSLQGDRVRSPLLESVVEVQLAQLKTMLDQPDSIARIFVLRGVGVTLSDRQP